jgi:spore coat protein A
VLLGVPNPNCRRQHGIESTSHPLPNVEDAPYLNPQTHLPDVTTKPKAGATEDWLLVNTTADTHPIHLHLVTFEVIDRRAFDVESYDPLTQKITYTGPPVQAAANENGRKDTVQAHPAQVTRIRASFDLPDEGTIQLPPGSRTHNTSGTATSSSTKRTT